MSTMTGTVLFEHPDLGRIFTPQDFTRIISVPGRPAHRPPPGQFGLVVAVQRRPIVEADGFLRRMALIWHSITHNERVDAGAAQQAAALFSSSTTAFTAVAIASASLTKTKTDQSLGTASSGATTNEFTSLGLSRGAGTVSTYTAPSALGGQYAQLVTKTFTASGSGTAYGSGLFNSTTPAGSILYVEDNFGSTSVLVSGDTLQIAWTNNN